MKAILLNINRKGENKVKKILFIVFVCTIFIACNNREIEHLQKENNTLKIQIEEFKKEKDSLQAQIIELSETEQNRFNKAVDLLNAANSLEEYREAEKSFTDFIEKFPTSGYMTEAQKNKQTAMNKADNIETVSTAKTNIKSLIAEHKWKEAINKLNSIKILIEKDEYDAIMKQIENERYKPEKTTIDKLVSEIYDLSHSSSYEGILKYNEFLQKGKRVEVIGYAPYGFLNVKRKSISLYGKPGCSNGERIEVFYSKTNLVNHFLNLNPDIVKCGASYKIIGKARGYSNSSDIYIEAETIKFYKK